MFTDKGMKINPRIVTNKNDYDFYNLFSSITSLLFFPQ